MVANRSTQNRVPFFKRGQDGVNRNRVRDLQLHLAGHPREVAQMKWKLDPDHESVCVSTDNTAGRSRTMAFQLFPPFAEA